MQDRYHSKLGRRPRQQAVRGLFATSPYTRRLRAELLEDRRMLAVLTVNSLADNTLADGWITLREAIHAANNNTIADAVEGVQAGSGDDVILFDTSVFTGGSASLIRLTQGELEITETLTIDGSAAVEIVITGDANGNDSLVAGTLITDVALSAAANQLDDNTRVFNFSAPTGDLTLQSLTITGGRTTDYGVDGAGVCFGSDGLLTLIDSTVHGNSTVGHPKGGGIYTYSGAVTLANSTVSGNSAVVHGGGFYTASGAVILTGSAVSGNGSGIYNRFGTITLTSSTISGNSTTGNSASDGGGIFSDSGMVSLTSSTVSGNSSSGDGGGMATRYGTVTLTGSTVNGNSTTGTGHGGGSYSASGEYIASGRVRLTNSTVSGNRSGGNGGGIATGGDAEFPEDTLSSLAVKLIDSTVHGNEAAGAGGGCLCL